MELSLKKVQELITEKRKTESERERLNWEVQVLRDKLAEIRDFFEEAKETSLLLEGHLQDLLPRFKEHRAFLTEKGKCIEEGKRSEHARSMIIQKKKIKFGNWNGREKGLSRKMERVCLQEENCLWKGNFWNRSLKNWKT